MLGAKIFLALKPEIANTATTPPAMRNIASFLARYFKDSYQLISLAIVDKQQECSAWQNIPARCVT
jgi:hypothetical protein